MQQEVFDGPRDNACVRQIRARHDENGRGLNRLAVAIRPQAETGDRVRVRFERVNERWDLQRR